MTLGRETSPLSTDSPRRGIEVVPPAIACQESFAVFARCKTERSNELTTGVESHLKWNTISAAAAPADCEMMLLVKLRASTDY